LRTIDTVYTDPTGVDSLTVGTTGIGLYRVPVVAFLVEFLDSVAALFTGLSCDRARPSWCYGHTLVDTTGTVGCSGIARFCSFANAVAAIVTKNSTGIGAGEGAFEFTSTATPITCFGVPIVTTFTKPLSTVSASVASAAHRSGKHLTFPTTLNRTRIITAVTSFEITVVTAFATGFENPVTAFTAG
jgi:hypothetical protein